MIENGNVYRRARMAASVRNARLASMERAAEELYISSKSLGDYETGRSCPPCDAVARMREVYGEPDLVGQHIRAVCPLMQDYGRNGPSVLAEAALGWALAMGDAQEVARSFAAVARDGRITPEEERAARLIRTRAGEIMRVMQETVTAIDKALGEAGL
ncbi:MAG: hypothetical protein VB104_07795 [Candidatus Limiplasma sp.]|nr:hypothetical protein [Candidatus Limiplasma sp.]